MKKNHRLHDLYTIHADKINNGQYSEHPHLWIARNFKNPLSWIDLNSEEVEFFVVGGNHISSYQDVIEVFERLGPTKRRREGYYYSSDRNAEKYKELKVSDNNIESAIKDRMQHLNESIILESVTPVGSIDCETTEEIIEVKRISNWKNGLGQILAYSFFRPNHKMKLHLFGCYTDLALMKHIKDICALYNIQVDFEYQCN